MREIVFDTETTGLDVSSGHKLVEIGCVELIGRMPTGRTWHHYINPEREIEAGAMRIHGITNEKVADKPTFAQLVDDFLKFIADAPLVAHNASFDMGFLNTQLEELGHEPLKNEVVDTLAMARQLFPGAQHNLDALCRRYEVDLSVRTFHGALLDADLLAQVYLEMTGGRQPGLDLNSEDGEEDNHRYRATQARPARAFPPTDEEVNRWQAFVGDIKDNLWQIEKDS